MRADGERGLAADLFIATPTADAIMVARYVDALVQMSDRLDKAGIRHRYHTVNGSDLVVQRNQLAASFLASPCTHLLFIDSDMTFPPGLAEDLLAAGKPVIGTIYPRRALDMAAVRTRLDSASFPHALALSYGWNVRILGSTVTVADGLCRVDGLGGGFLLIRRDCFDALLARTDVPFVTSGDPREPRIRAFFRDMPIGEDVMDLDYAFCRRWIEAGGEVWALPAAAIGHCGEDRAGVPFSHALAALTAACAPPGDGALVLSSSLQPG